MIPMRREAMVCGAQITLDEAANLGTLDGEAVRLSHAFVPEKISREVALTPPRGGRRYRLHKVIPSPSMDRASLIRLGAIWVTGYKLWGKD